MSTTEIAIAIAIAVGLAGIVVPVLPGSLLVLVAILVWASELGGSTAWAFAAAAAAIIVLGNVVKYLLPGKRLKATVPTSTLWVGALGALIGFFAIPVVGVFVGFPLGVYVAERHRLGAGLAGRSTRQALKAVGVSILIELAAAVVATLVWVAGVLAT